MRRTDRFSTLLRLAQHQENECTRALGLMMQKRQSMQQQLELLGHYAEEYRSNRTVAAATPPVLADQRRFVDRLDTHRREAEERLAAFDNDLEQLRLRWRQARARRASLEQLLQQQKQQASQAERRREQRETDELARRGSQADDLT